MVDRVDYTTIREEFSVYEIENGQILKAKVSLVDLFNLPDENNVPRGKISIQGYSYVITPPDIDTTGMEVTNLPVTEKDQAKELKFKTIKEAINIYETKKAIILIGLKMEKIFLTNKLNQKKEPILRYQSVNGIDAIQKPDFGAIQPII